MSDLELTYERVRFWAGRSSNPRAGKSHYARFYPLVLNLYSWGL